MICLWAAVARAETIRIATFNVELDRDGPGLLLRDILSGKDDQVAAVAQVVAQVAPDILLLQNVDYDHGNVALGALRDRIARDGPRYPHMLALRPNTGMATGLDMDGDGRRGRARDKQGYGAFAGQGGMALLSRLPIARAQVRDFSALLWQDMPGAIMPRVGGAPFPSAAAAARQRLASVGHWAVPFVPEGGDPLHLLAFHAAPPVFDGPEDRNGRRNHDELRFWQLYLDGRFGPAPAARFVLAGVANIDPVDGEGRKQGIKRLLEDARLQDPRPVRPGPVAAQPDQRGDPALDTVDWPPPGPGRLRVDYVLPSADLRVLGAAVHWPPEDTPDGMVAARASRHRIVWVDIALP